MATQLTDGEIKDLIIGTTANLGPPGFKQVAQKLTSYEFMDKILRRDRVKFDGGTHISRRLMVQHSGAARHVGMWDNDDVKIGDVLKEINVPWRMTTTNWLINRLEIARNRGKQKIVNLVKLRRADAMLALVELMEDAFVGGPASPDDKLTPWGLATWLPPDATKQGHFGPIPAGWTAPPWELDHPNFKHYVDGYKLVSKADLIRRMRRTHRKIGFKSPLSIPDFRDGNGRQCRIYLPETTHEQMESLAEDQNQNLGHDLASMDGITTFKRNPMIPLPSLEGDTNYPVRFINFDTFHPFFLEGEYLRESEPKDTENHNAQAVFIDLTWNMLCDDLRRNATLGHTTGTPPPFTGPEKEAA